MAALYSPFKQVKAYEHVAEELKHQIIGGQLTPGDKLPTEQELARRFAVSRSAVRQALTLLSHMGLLEVRHGSGSYVTLHSDRLFFTSLDLVLSLEKDSMLELLEMKELLECRAASLAAQRASGEDIKTLEKTYAEMAQNIRAVERFAEANFHFHLHVAQASGNPFIAAMVRAVLNLLAQARPRLFILTDDPQGSLEQHRRILEAIKARDADGAQRAMYDHIRKVEDKEARTLGQAGARKRGQEWVFAVPER